MPSYGDEDNQNEFSVSLPQSFQMVQTDDFRLQNDEKLSTPLTENLQQPKNFENTVELTLSHHGT